MTSHDPPRLLQNIQSQPESLAGALAHHRGDGRAPLVEAAGILKRATRVVITGLGASLNASIPFEHRLCAAGLDATLVESAELLHYPRSIDRDSVVVVVSRSGESIEIARLLPWLRGRAKTIGVTNDPKSSLARGVDQAIDVRSLPDELIAIQSYTGTLLALDLLAAGVTGEIDAVADLAHEAIDLLRGFIRQGVEELASWDGFVARPSPIHFIARGPSIGSAFEGALLFNETAKVPAVGVLAATFRHGPVEIVDEQFTALVLASPTATQALNLALARDLVRFGGRVRVVGPRHPDFLDLDWCETPEAPVRLVPWFEVVPLQLAALRLAQLRGLSVGQFRYAPQVAHDEASFDPPAGGGD